MRHMLGATVFYVLNEDDAAKINKRREDAQDNMQDHRDAATGVMVHVGNDVAAGDCYPMIITKIHGDSPTSSVNGTVMLDGSDTFWATSVSAGEGPRTWSASIRTAVDAALAQTAMREAQESAETAE